VARAAACFALLSVTGCQQAVNYPVPTGPRYAGSPGSARRGVPLPVPDSLRFVTFNIQWGRYVGRAIHVLRSEEPARSADFLTLQEVDEKGTRQVARAFGMFYVYYPSAIHPKTDRDFGNAVLSRWPIVQDWKVVLPHRGRFRDTERAATAATILLGHDSLRVYSVHLSTMGELGPSPRREQARAVVADAMRFPLVVIGGDLNGLGVGEEFQACGFSWPTRDNVPTINLFTWDHVFLKGLAVNAATGTGVVQHDNGASDHRPVWVVASREGPAHSEPPGLGGSDGSSVPAGCLAVRQPGAPD
jgi:endonuclease/exonuclease/phosphatase family metal-dependent hydrolase